MRTLVAGVDSSTQSCKVVVRDAEDGTAVRSGSAAHPDGSEVDPRHWWSALALAIERAGGLDDVAALSVGGQQHGMVALDDTGAVIRDALLWNDTRSARAAADLIAELGGPKAWADAVGTVPTASFTVTKLRWLAEHEPDNAARVAAVALPHDWLTWRLAGGADHADLDTLTTDRGDASGTGYYATRTGTYLPEHLTRALGHGAHLPRVAGPAEQVGTAGPVRLGPGTGDNAAVALGVGAEPGDVVVSIGTSGTVFAVSDTPTADETGTIAGFADATGRHLPLVCTLNAARVLTATREILSVDLDRLSELALSAPPGADGVVFLPYLEGERTPNRPDATGSVHGLTLATSTPAHLARAAVEGVLCGLADGLDALTTAGVRADRVVLVGGGARSAALRAIAPGIFGRPVLVPEPAEYAAEGAARQAAWTLTGEAEPPRWGSARTSLYEADPTPHVRARYAEVRDA
ncbi:xylulokinase [Actinokineospora spheciospongiae]|uniref:xylulokinase n=1 Tax=Actinokineospora spheciospongiae TaxID=909613 RepID=UPI000D71B85E|nr:xylulokinase [Actinokineospora spheciospongiae]PWW54888.1 xylulokinase [Actinokineospora spheciospongiae]